MIHLALRLNVLPSQIYAMSEWDFLLCLAAIKLDHEAQEKKRQGNTMNLLDGFDDD